jgi:hypothetical protein
MSFRLWTTVWTSPSRLKIQPTEPRVSTSKLKAFVLSYGRHLLIYECHLSFRLHPLRTDFPRCAKDFTRSVTQHHLLSCRLHSLREFVWCVLLQFPIFLKRWSWIKLWRQLRTKLLRAELGQNNYRHRVAKRPVVNLLASLIILWKKILSAKTLPNVYICLFRKCFKCYSKSYRRCKGKPLKIMWLIDSLIILF